MKGITSLRKTVAAATAVAAVAIALCAAPQKAEAASTSAGATVFNKVTVTYASGSVTGLVTSSSVKVTVTTLAAAPTVTVGSQAESILSGASKIYNYTIRSNSNGTDTYTLTTEGSSDSNMNTANTDTLSTPPAGIKLWGGFATGSDAGYITVPGGSLTLNPIADNTTVMLVIGGVNHAYSVASTSAGNAADSTTKENADKIFLNPLSGAPAINGNVAAGTQVGEYTTFTNTVKAGDVKIDSSSSTIADGTHLTVVKVVTAATDLNKNLVTYLTSSGDNNLTTTTILAPKLSIVKKSRNVTAGEATFTLSGTTARPGEVVEYEITITNLHNDSGAVISNANVLDTLPSYSTYVAGSTKINYNGAGFGPVLDNGTASPLADPGYNLTSPLGAQQTAVITYQAQVN